MGFAYNYTAHMVAFLLEEPYYAVFFPDYIADNKVIESHNAYKW